MYRQATLRKSPGFYEETDRKNHLGSYMDSGSKDMGRANKSANLQEIFLNNCRKNENVVHIELLRGEKRTGRIVGFDTQSVILASKDSQLLIYKSAIAAVVPENPVQYIFNELHKRDYYDPMGLCCLDAGAEETRNNA